MAEYCSNCADKYGMEKEQYPLFCEGCATYFQSSNCTKTAQNRLKKAIIKILNVLKISKK